ncbi:MAG: transposase [Thermomonas sp.]|nr:transposase [Thermomonas sp.]
MTTARSLLIPPASAGTFHCVQRCVRRAFLCGQDRYTGQSFEHRKHWVEQRIALLAESFAVAIHAYAVMSNHLHLVLQIEPAATGTWSDIDVANRWVRVFPPREHTEAARVRKRDALLQQPERLAVLRTRLADLSWFMKCLAEPVARAANAEDGCKGRFWEGRFKVQLLCDERALLAAMAYVDLNPIRAGMADALADADHTSIQRRLADIQSPQDLDRPLRPLAGTAAPGIRPASACVPTWDWGVDRRSCVPAALRVEEGCPWRAGPLRRLPGALGNEGAGHRLGLLADRGRSERADRGRRTHGATLAQGDRIGEAAGSRQLSKWLKR